MYTSFTAKNFRLFKDLTIEPLARVNLIGGKNNTGKTALLEALWIYSAPLTTDTTVRVNVFRGISAFPADAQTIWNNLFHGYKTEAPILLSAEEDGSPHHQIEITLQPETETTLPLKPANGDGADNQEQPTFTAELTWKLVFKYVDSHDPDRRTFTTHGEVTPEGIRFPARAIPFSVPKRMSIILPARFRTNPQEQAHRFGNIQDRLEENLILEGLQIVEPALEDIRLRPYGNITVFVGLEKGKKEREPLALMGDGLNHFLEILLAIADARDGVVLIDEIENGLHYTLLADVWRLIRKLAEHVNAQVFATTHSRECIHAAQKAFGEEPGDTFKYHRLDKINEEIKVTTYSDEAFAGAIEYDIEVR